MSRQRNEPRERRLINHAHFTPASRPPHALLFPVLTTMSLFPHFHSKTCSVERKESFLPEILDFSGYEEHNVFQRSELTIGCSWHVQRHPRDVTSVCAPDPCPHHQRIIYLIDFLLLCFCLNKKHIIYSR